MTKLRDIFYSADSMRKNLNIPINLINKYKGSKRGLELLSFAIAIKMAHSNSCFTYYTYAKVRRLLRCSHPKAVQILKDAQNSELFYCDASQSFLRANSFKDKNPKKSKGGREYTSDWCYKLEIKDYSLRELVSTLREILLENVIYAKERQLNNAWNINGANPVAVTQTNLGNAVGVSRVTAQNILKKIKSRGTDLKKSNAVIKPILSHANDETIREYKKITHSKGLITYCMVGFIVLPCLYSILGENESCRFQHIIYNHRNMQKAELHFDRSSDKIIIDGHFASNNMDCFN